MLLDIVFASDDFKYLWIADKDAPEDAWRMDFFINPPKGKFYVYVKVLLQIITEKNFT